MWTLAHQHGTRLNDVVFANSTRGIAVGHGGGILFTSNGGATWTAATSGTSNDLYSVTMKKSVALACGDGGVILKSTDYGATWSALTSGTSENLRAIHHAGSVAWACGGAALLRSTDLVAWSAISGITEEMTALAFWREANSVVVATTANGVLPGTTATPRLTMKLWRTLDAGATWSNELEYQAAVGPTDVYASRLLASSATRYDLVGGHHATTLTRLWFASNDAGDTWAVPGTLISPTASAITHWNVARSERGAILIVGDSIGFPNLYNPFCVAVGDSPTAWTINRIDTAIVHDYCATAFSGSIPLLDSSPISDPCIWQSSEMGGACSWSLDISGVNATLTLTVGGDTCTYTKPMSDWEVDGANLLEFSSGTAGTPNILKVWLCATDVAHCAVCTEWNHYEITIPAIATYTAGATEDATWISGSCHGSTCVCTWETANLIDGFKAHLTLSRTTTGFGNIESAAITWNGFSWIKTLTPLTAQCITDTLPQDSGPASAPDASYALAP